MPHPHHLIARAPFADLSSPNTKDNGVRVLDRDGLGLASVLAKRTRADALSQRLRERLQIELPREPRRTVANDLALIGAGPGAWLAARERGGNAFCASLREAIGDLASVSDQSDGYAVLRLSGRRLRNALAKLVPLDLHPRAFPVGRAAATSAAHIGVTLWRLPDGADGALVFELALYRGFASSFWHALTESAAEFGLVVDLPRKD